ncbi:MAG TPA: hypothetical protein VMI06_13280, partial [Terriglobia bacterium]|nr:hypothetical protein [Terriglobia bacterium]
RVRKPAIGARIWHAPWSPCYSRLTAEIAGGLSGLRVEAFFEHRGLKPKNLGEKNARRDGYQGPSSSHPEPRFPIPELEES